MNWNCIIASICIGLMGCTQTATQATTPLQKSSAVVGESEDAMRARRKLQRLQWPLKFKEHGFSARCYDTLKCSVWYAGLDQGDDRPSPPSSKYGPGYLADWSGGHIGIPNFPGPAEVTWRTRDGRDHKAEIDIAAIFRDELIRHNVPREELPEFPDGKYVSDPSILLEVNDLTIRVYMRAHISTIHLRTPGNPYSDYRNDLILVKTYKY